MKTNRSPVRVALLGNDPSDEQWSMLEYGARLQEGLDSLLGASGRITLTAPESRFLLWMRRARVGRAASMYWSRYVLYPRRIRNIRADIYHILDHGNSWLLKHLDPARSVVTCHDLIPFLFPEWRESTSPAVSSIALRHTALWLTRAATLIANSGCTKKDLTARLGYPAERIHIIPLGVDRLFCPPATPEESRATRAALGLPSETLLLHVGQTAFYKNLEGVLRCLHVLTRRGERMWLIRSGAPLHRRHRRLASELKLSHRILELGYLPRGRVAQLYQATDLLVYPSWYEGQGLPPLEAMASGLPVIVSNRGALPETVGEAGLIVDPESPEKIADAVQRIARDSVLRDELRRRGLQRARQFRWEDVAQKTLRVYESILSPVM